MKIILGMQSWVNLWKSINIKYHTNIIKKKTHHQKHIKRCFILLVIKKMQIETTMRYNSISIKIARIKKSHILINAGEDIYKSKPLGILSGKAKWCSTWENSLAVLQIVKHRLTIWFSNFTRRYLPKGNENTCAHKSVCTMLIVLFIFIVRWSNPHG